MESETKKHFLVWSLSCYFSFDPLEQFQSAKNENMNLDLIEDKSFKPVVSDWSRQNDRMFQIYLNFSSKKIHLDRFHVLDVNKII